MTQPFDASKLLTVARLAHGDRHLGLADAPSIPYPGADDVTIRPLQIDLRNNRACSVTRFGRPGVLGRHHHSGEVLSYTLAGSWKYLEHEWVATPGSFVFEPAGMTHTLSIEGSEGATILFVQHGSADFVDDDGIIGERQDAFWLFDLYTDHCERNGIHVDDRVVV